MFTLRHKPVPNEVARVTMALGLPIIFLCGYGMFVSVDWNPRRIDGSNMQTWVRTSNEATRGLEPEQVEEFRLAVETLIHNEFYDDPSYGQDVYDARTLVVTNGKTVREIVSEARKHR